jgi:hypothetical protein
VVENQYTADNPQEIPHLIRAAVSDCHDIETHEIARPLGLAIDVDSLIRLWWPSGRFPYDADGELSFDYYDCRVTVTSEGQIKARLK